MKFIEAKYYTKGREGSTVKKITIHHMAGVLTAEECGRVFQKRQASAHYGIGYNGEMAQYVREKDSAWADGNWNSNKQSITIECANDRTGGEWHVSDATLKSLINLCAKICKRYGFKAIKGKTITWHSMYASTTCCGDYLRSKMDYICNEVNAILEGSKQPVTPSKPSTEYNYDPVKKLSVKEAIMGGQSEGNKFCGTDYEVDGIVGADTERLKSKVLQHAMNIDYIARLDEDGIFGTRSKKTLAYHTVRKGETQAMVRALQILLLLNGYNPHGVDGIFGSGTEKATRQFQADTGLTVDGIAGRNTFLKLV